MEWAGRFVLVDTDDHPASGEALPRAIALRRPANRHPRGQTEIPRLTRVTQPGTGSAWSPDSTVLVTGATGALGRLVARHLVERHGVRNVVLAGRRGHAAEGMAELEAELVRGGASVSVVACDIADRDAVASLLADHPVTAVVHAAGVIDDGLVTSLSPERLRNVLAPKVLGAVWLDELTRDRELTEFVLFSSASATIGNAGQAAYSAANAFLDALAHRRRAQGLPAHSLGWGLWEQRSAMTRALRDADLARIARTGLAPLSSDEGLALLDAAVELDDPALLPMRLDTAALRRSESVPPVLAGLVRPRRPAAQTSTWTERMRLLSDAERGRAAMDLVRTRAAAVLDLAGADAVGIEQSFADLGFDSLTAVELRNRLNAATGLRLSTTLVFDYPTPAALADYVLGETTGSDPAAAGVAAAAVRADEPMAIIGMACRYPGGVLSPDELWELVAEGRDVISGFPA